MMLSIVAGYVVGGGLIWLGLTRSFDSLKATSRQLFRSVGVVVVLIAVAMTFDEMFNWWTRMPKIVFLAAGILIVGERSFRALQGTKRGGAVLLDLGRVQLPDMIINVFIGLALVWFAWMDISGLTNNPHWTLQDISVPVFGLSIAYAVLLQALAKRSILEQGIFYGTGLLPWGDIRTFEWEKDSALSSTLVLRKQSRLPLFQLATFSVKTEVIPTLEELLLARGITPSGGKTPA